MSDVILRLSNINRPFNVIDEMKSGCSGPPEKDQGPEVRFELASFMRED